jgi:tripartite-type tricarboxylate transporter receptor subunit TctC
MKKKYILGLLLLFTPTLYADDTTKIIYSGGPTGGIFIPKMGAEYQGILKMANDGQDALQLALETENSFLSVGNAASFVSKHFYKNYKDPYEYMDFVAIIGNFPFVIASSPNTAKSIDELVEKAKQNNKPLTLGGGNNISTCAIAGKWIQAKYDIKVDYIYYKNYEQGYIDAIAGRLDLVCRYLNGIPTEQDKDRIVPLLKFSNSNYGILKTVPVGIPINQLQVILTRKDTPKEIREKFVKALTDEKYLSEVKKLDSSYFEFFTDFDQSKLKTEIELYKPYFDEAVKKDPHLSKIAIYE